MTVSATTAAPRTTAAIAHPERAVARASQRENPPSPVLMLQTLTPTTDNVVRPRQSRGVVFVGRPFCRSVQLS